MKYWRRKQFLAVLMVFSLIGTAGCGRVSGTGPNGRGVEEKESVVPEENGGKATPENSSESEGGTDTRVNDEDEITESDFKKQYQSYCEASISKFLQLNWGENPGQGTVLYSPVIFIWHWECCRRWEMERRDYSYRTA